MAIDPRIIPTASRIIDPTNHVPPGTYGVTTSTVPIRLPNRRTLDALDWWLDCSSILAPASDDYVSTIQTSVTPAGTAGDLVVSDVKSLEQYAGMMLVGGRLDISYTVVATVTTATGRTMTVEMSNRVAGVGITPGQSGSSEWPLAEPSDLRIKRGETLIFQVTAVDDGDVPIDITNMEVIAQARSSSGDLIATLDVDHTDELSVALVQSPTDLWPLGQVSVDFRAVVDDQVAYSETIVVNIDRPVTT